MVIRPPIVSRDMLPRRVDEPDNLLAKLVETPQYRDVLMPVLGKHADSIAEAARAEDDQGGDGVDRQGAGKARSAFAAGQPGGVTAHCRRQRIPENLPASKPFEDLRETAFDQGLRLKRSHVAYVF